MTAHLAQLCISWAVTFWTAILRSGLNCLLPSSRGAFWLYIVQDSFKMKVEIEERSLREQMHSDDWNSYILGWQDCLNRSSKPGSSSGGWAANKLHSNELLLFCKYQLATYIFSWHSQLRGWGGEMAAILGSEATIQQQLASWFALAIPHQFTANSITVPWQCLLTRY